MKKKEQLFLLVKSLSKAEKGYFKKFSSRHVIGEKNNYIKLFDVIEKQKDYDEKRIKEELKNEAFIRHLPEAKYYLQKLIIKSLTAFHSESRVDYKIKELIHSIEILREKNLHEYCMSLLDKAKAIALKYERYILLMEILFLERILISDTKDIARSEKFYATFSSDIIKYSELIVNSAKMHTLQEKITHLEMKYGPTRESEKLVENEKLYREEIVLLAAAPLSFETKRNLMSVYHLYYKYKGDLINSYINSKNAMDWMEEHMELTRQILPRYVAAIHNYLIGCLYLFRYEEFDAGIKKLREIPKRFSGADTDELRLFVFKAFHLELDKYLRTGEFKKGLKLVPEAEVGLEEFEGRITVLFEMLTIFNVAYMYFGAGEYKQALKWTNKLINNPSVDIRIDTQILVRLLNIMIHFELGNFDMIEYLLKSTYRFVEQKKRMYKIESLMLKFFSEASKQNNPELHQQLFMALKTDLTLITSDPLEKAVFDEFDFFSWVESKLENKSFEEIVREKSRNKQSKIIKLLDERSMEMSSNK